MPISRALTFCRLCPASCGVVVTLDDRAAVSVAGDRQHPLSRGYTCPKGRRLAALPYDPHRLNRPMIRGRSGDLVEVGWDSALEDLAQRLTSIVERHGPYSVGNYGGTTLDSGGRFAAGRLMAAVGSPSRYTSSTVDSVAKVLVGKLMSGREGLVPSVDFDTTSLLVVIGENMVVSHGGFSYFPDPVRYLRSVARRGEVWVLDPRRTETARLSTHHLRPRPGTDFAVLAHLVRQMLHNGADQPYLRDHALHVGELSDAVERFDAQTTESLTGIDPADLERLAAALRHHRRLAVVTGTGVTMAATGNVTEWMAYALQVVTGSFERPGGRWFNHSAAMDPDAPGGPKLGPGDFEPGPRSHPEIPRMANQYPCAVMADEIEQGHLRAVLVTGGNPLTAFPQPDRLGRAFDSLDVLAVWDVVRSVTAERATHLFPCPDPLERADLVTPVHLSMVYAQYTDPVVEAAPGRRPMWWSLAELGRLMGLGVLPGDLDPRTCSDHDVFAAMVDATPVSWEALRSAGGAAVSYPRRDRWVERSVLPDGRWDVAPPQLVEQFDHALQRPLHPLVLGNRREVHHTNSTLAWGVGDAPAGRPRAYLSRPDAEAAGVAGGDTVEIVTAHGSVRAEACIEEGLAAGTVAIPHGFSDPNVGHLTSGELDVDPLSGMPTLIGVPASVTAVWAARPPIVPS